MFVFWHFGRFYANFFTYSESPFNSLIDEGLKFKNYPMGIEVMASLPLKAMLPDRAAMLLKCSP